MRKMRTLTRRDIVGRRIRCVYRSRGFTDDEGYWGCVVYVELDSGVILALDSEVKPGEVRPIDEVDPTSVALIRVDEGILTTCAERTVAEVIVSEFWLGIALLLDDGHVLFLGECDFRRVGPCVSDSRSGSDFRVSEFRPYWP